MSTEKCMARSEPWDVCVTMRCDKPKGHTGNHAHTVEWDDEGDFVEDANPYGTLMIGEGDGEPITIPPIGVDSLSNFQPLGAVPDSGEVPGTAPSP